MVMNGQKCEGEDFSVDCCEVSAYQTDGRKFSSVSSAFDQGFSDRPPAFGLGFVINTVAKKYNDVQSLTTNIVYKLMQEKHQGKAKTPMLLCDIRPPEEYNVSHLPGAIRLDPDNLDMKLVQNILKEYSSKNEFPAESKVKVVMYCAVGYRASVMVDRYTEGRKKKVIDEDCFDLYNLEGSIFKWGNEKRPMVDENEELTSMVHQFSPIWGKFLFKEIRK